MTSSSNSSLPSSSVVVYMRQLTENRSSTRGVSALHGGEVQQSPPECGQAAPRCRRRAFPSSGAVRWLSAGPRGAERVPLPDEATVRFLPPAHWGKTEIGRAHV